MFKQVIAKVFGDVAHGTGDEGSPVKVGGVARTSNPTAVESGDRTNSFFDKVGRQVTYPYQVRELISTARVTLTGGSGGSTETTLVAAPASTFLDLYQITAVNTSTNTLTAGSIQLDIRDATGGGIVSSVMIPDDDTRVIHFNPPLPQNTSAATWTVQTAGEISAGTNIIISATFVQNV